MVRIQLIILFLVFFNEEKDSENYCLDIVKPSNSLKLHENSFNELLSHEKPNRNMITRSKGSSDFDIKFENFKSNSIENWLTMRSLEYIIPNYLLSTPTLLKARDNFGIFRVFHLPCRVFHLPRKSKVKIGKMALAYTRLISTPHIIEDSEDVSASQFDVKTLLPSFSATNSLIKDIDLGITNVFTIPLIPGPFSSYSATYTALKKAQGISTWTCPSSSRATVSLDLDLYEKAYQLVGKSDFRFTKFSASHH